MVAEKPKMSLAEKKATIKKEMKRLSPYLKFEPKTIQGKPIAGEFEDIRGILRNVEQIPDKFAKEGELRFRYRLTLEVDSMEKYYDATQTLWNIIDDSGAEYGDTLVLSRTGEMKSTRYTVTNKKND